MAQTQNNQTGQDSQTPSQTPPSQGSNKKSKYTFTANVYEDAHYVEGKTYELDGKVAKKLTKFIKKAK